MRARWRLLLGAVALLAFGIGIISYVQETREHVRAKITTGRMLALYSELRAGEPERLDPESLYSFLDRVGRKEYARDGWGHPLTVERIKGEDGASHYRIVSLGRDGKTGSCCHRWTYDDWDADAVLLDDAWLQVW